MAFVFGDNSLLGTTEGTYGTDVIIACRYLCGSNTNIRSLYFWGTILASSEDARLALYDDSGNLLGETEDLPYTFATSNGLDMASEVAVTSGTYYYIAFHSGAAGCNLRHDLGDAQTIIDASGQTYASGAPDPFPSDEDTYGSRSLMLWADDAWIIPPTGDTEATAAMLMSL